MITGIDHIVIAVHSLERAMATYRGLGFTVVAGGRHPYGSYNALIGFADGSYIEIISFYEDSPAHPWWDLLHERGGGLIDFCLATDDIRGDLEILSANGVDCGELTDGGRARPDGYQVRWLNNKVGGGWQGLIPFLIEDVTPRDERLPRERQHANGVTGIHTLRLMTDDVAGAGAVMAALLGDAGQADGDGIGFEVGGQRIEYVAGPERAPYSVSFKTSGTRGVLGWMRRKACGLRWFRRADGEPARYAAAQPDYCSPRYAAPCASLPARPAASPA